MKTITLTIIISFISFLIYSCSINVEDSKNIEPKESEIITKSEPKRIGKLILERSEYQKEVDRVIQAMKNNENWKNELEKKSIERNIQLDSLMYSDAVWILRKDSIFYIEDEVKQIIKLMKSNSGWKTEITKKAKERGNSVEQQMRNDALFMIRSDNK
ncbi:MAG: hypothetical protein JXR60_06785 [Bacteroidales bacterium]|nr:hypothetical protein [Bacteroidales bacterium]